MPGHEWHKPITKFVLGREFEEVHRLMDLPVLALQARHRMFFHDPLSLLLMFGNDPEKLRAAYVHLLTDNIFSNKKMKNELKKLGLK